MRGRIKKHLSILTVIAMIMTYFIPISRAVEKEHDKNQCPYCSLYQPDYTKQYGLEKNKNIKNLGVKPKTKRSRRSADVNNTVNIKYIAVLIEFPDEDMQNIRLDSDEALSIGQMIAKTGGTGHWRTSEYPLVSVKDYFKKYSYGKINVDMEYFPKNENNRVVSFVAPHPRTYYMRNTPQNPDGFTNANMLSRETELLNSALASVKASLESTYTRQELDQNNDGYLDGINFFVEDKFPLDYENGKTIKRGDLLWSHKADNYLPTSVHGLKIGKYTVNNAGDPSSPGSIFSYKVNNGEVIAERTNYSVIVHEFLHTFGLFDLYRATEDGEPVGFFDIMAFNHPLVPQNVLTIHSREMLNWGDKIQEMRQNTPTRIYKPKYQDSTEKTSYKIMSTMNPKEYFVVEYYDKPNLPSSVGAKNGLIIYRVRKDVWSNLEGSKQTPEKDFVFIFRPNETELGEANKNNLDQAVISGVGTTYGKLLKDTANTWDKDTLYFSDGKNSGIKLEITDETEDYIEVNFTAPTFMGSGTENDPYLISNKEEFKSLVRGNTYSKLVTDIDFEEENMGSLSLDNGNFDGDGHTLSNIKIANGEGLFSSITDGSVKNLFIENISVAGSDRTHVGALVGAFNSGLVDNVHIKSGTVIGGVASPYGFQGVGGLIGTILNGATVQNSSTNANVQNGQYIGGFIGLAQGGIVNGNTATGKVTFVAGEKAGGFYGSHLKLGGDSDATYSNNLFLVTNDELKKAQRIGQKQGVYGIEKLDDISLDINNNNSHTINLKTYGVDEPNIQIRNLQIENTEIATANNNVITGNKNGNTTYSLKASLGNASVDMIGNIAVTGETTKEVKPLESISFREAEKNMNLGDTASLKIIYNPEDTTDDKTATFESSDNNVVIVDSDGNIRTIGKGQARITARVGNLTAHIMVNVFIPSTHIETDESDITLNIGDNKGIIARLLPENTTDIPNFTFTSDNENIATVSNSGIITGVGVGNTRITIRNTGERNHTKIINVVVNTPAPREFAYTVEHYQQNIENDDYTLRDSETLSGTENSEIMVNSKDYQGFHLNSEMSTLRKVLTDNNMTVKVYYDRNIYNISFDGNGYNKGSLNPVMRVKYESNITIPNPTFAKDGFNFNYWKGSVYKPNDIYKVVDNHSFVAQWMPIVYKVKYRWINEPNGVSVPTDNNTYYWHDKIELDTEFTKGYKIETDSGIWTFEGWHTPDYDIETGIEKDITILGNWNFVEKQDDSINEKDSDKDKDNENGQVDNDKDKDKVNNTTDEEKNDNIILEDNPTKENQHNAKIAREDKTNKSNSVKKIVQTGDNKNMNLLCMMSILSLCLFVVLRRLNKDK